MFLPGKSHGQRSLEGCSPWGRWGSDRTERLHFHFSLSCIGEGNGTPLQCSCLENPRDGEPGGLRSMGSQSWTRLKWVSSSSSSDYITSSWRLAGGYSFCPLLMPVRSILYLLYTLIKLYYTHTQKKISKSSIITLSRNNHIKYFKHSLKYSFF